MSWFNRYIVAPLAPRFALRREAAQRAVRAYYEAGQPSRVRKTRVDRSSANALNQKSAETIRTQARHLDENHDIASGILDALVANTVGTGIQPEPQVQLLDGKPADELNRALAKLFEDWRFTPEVTWQHDYFGLQRMVARSWFRDGEVFANRVTGPVSGIDHGTIVPYSIEALEADFVPYDYANPKTKVSQGIEVNDWGRPRAYYVFRRHPGDSLGGVAQLRASTDTKRVSADTMMHLAFRKRLHQLRGISIFATVINRLDDIKEIDESERIAAKVAASMAAFIKKGAPDDYVIPEITEGNPQGLRQMGFEAGIIFDDLQPGEEVGTIGSTRPNNALIPFRDSQLRSAAAGTMASFSTISKNYDGSYSAQRQELVEHYMLYQMLAGPMIYGFCQPVWDGFVNAAIVSGQVVLPPNVDKTTLYDCTHTGPAMPWVDPEKEVNARVLAMQWKLTSRSRVIRESGRQPDQINREILRDEDEAQRLGIDISGPEPPGSAPPADPPDNADPPARTKATREPRSPRKRAS